VGFEIKFLKEAVAAIDLLENSPKNKSLLKQIDKTLEYLASNPRHPSLNTHKYSFLIGIVVSVGPFIYAHLIRENFWLRGNISMGLAHELKSPLATIQSATQILIENQTQSDPDKAKAFDYLHMVQRNTERLELFIQDLLKVAQIQSEAITLQKNSIDLCKTIQETASTYAHLTKSKGISIELDFADASTVEADQAKIQQILSNLLANALKFSERGTIRLSTFKKGQSIHCTVSDTGHGIAKADLERVFERFFHGKNSSKGSGLGLAIAKAWVEAHGGKIWAESEGEGKGTTVTFTLPLN